MKKYFKKTCGLALGSGAAKGLAHIGILKALLETGIKIHALSGCSIGAVVGAYFARHSEIKGLEDIALKTNWKLMMELADPKLFLLTKGLFHGEKVKKLLKTLIGDVTFDELQIPFSVAATDAYTGEEVILEKGPVLEAVRASISIPGIFTPVKLEGRYLVDGGVINPVPVSILKKKRMSSIIACNVIDLPYKRNRFINSKKQKKEEFKKPSSLPSSDAFQNTLSRIFKENKEKAKDIQNLLAKVKKILSFDITKADPDMPSITIALIQSFYVMQYEIARSRMKGADIIISPETGHIATWEFYRAKEIIDIGYRTAKESLSKPR